MGLKLQTVPAAAGMRWISLAFNEFFRHPMAYAGVFGSFLFAVLLSGLLPFVGGVLLLMSVPLLTLAFMTAVRTSVQGQRPRLDVLLAPWQRQPPERRRALLALLLTYSALVAGSVWLATELSAGGFEAVFSAYAKGASPDELNRLMEAPGVATGLLWCFGLVSLVSLVFWFAPALVQWAGQGPAQALFSSTLAMWRARWAFVNYGVAWLGCSAGLVLGASLLAGLVGSGFASLLLLPLQLMLTCVFYVSLYFSFVDCFGEP